MPWLWYWQGITVLGKTMETTALQPPCEKHLCLFLGPLVEEMKKTHICLPRGWTWACEGQRAFILLIFVTSCFVGPILPFTVVPTRRSVSYLALNLVSCGVFLSRSSTNCWKRMKRALLFLSLPDVTFLWILCNLPMQEFLVLWGLNLQFSVHQIL